MKSACCRVLGQATHQGSCTYPAANSEGFLLHSLEVNLDIVSTGVGLGNHGGQAAVEMGVHGQGSAASQPFRNACLIAHNVSYKGVRAGISTAAIKLARESGRAMYLDDFLVQV